MEGWEVVRASIETVLYPYACDSFTACVNRAAISNTNIVLYIRLSFPPQPGGTWKSKTPFRRKRP